MRETLFHKDKWTALPVQHPHKQNMAASPFYECVERVIKSNTAQSFIRLASLFLKPEFLNYKKKNVR